ncbi:unnamed protein product [Trichobilharzia szidati]|nr:unnamed protein product [Trichobilharzia szidati]
MSKGMLAMRTQKIFAIKEGLSTLLDVTRQAYAEQLDDITSEVNRLARHYDLPLRLSHTKARGFYIQIPENALKNYKKPSSPEVVHEGSSASNHDNLSNENKFSDENDDDSQDFRRFSSPSESNKSYCPPTNTTPKQCDSPLQNLPDEFIVLITSRGVVQCTTETLIRLNERIKGCLFEVYHVSDQIICDLITRLHPDMALFYRISEVVASLDLLASFARMSMSCSIRDHFVYPIFTDVLGIKNGRNIITAQKRRSLCITNHTYASSDSNFHIITGPPMSGKTTYLRQIAYIQILAQIGSLVPAEFAAVRIADHIFYHTGGKDNLMLGESSFTNEIRGLRYILQNFSRSSIILIDGLCHNTNPDEVRHLNIAICEALLQHKAFTFFASSRHEMTFLTSVYPNVENYYFSIHEESINDDYRGHHTVDLDSSTTSSVNCSTLTIESPLVHSFSETRDSSRIKRWKNYSGLLTPHITDSTRITFTYKLVKGKPSKVLYAVELAKHFALPRKVLDRAEELLRMYISEQNASDGNRILMPGMHKDARNADKNSYSQLKGVQKQVMKTDLDETTSFNQEGTGKSDLDNDEENHEILSGNLSAIDRLENELYRQLEIISNAYENMSTMRHLSDSEKDKIEKELINYLQFLSCRYNAVFSKLNNKEEEEEEEDDDDDENEE